MARLDRFRTLILDAACRPVCAVSWRRALLLDLGDRIDVLEFYDEVVRTPTEAYPLPAVGRLRQVLRVHPRTVALTRRNLILRDGGRCQYCGANPPLRELTMDHVVPRSRGGATTWDNVVLACGPCNRRKGSRTPSEARMPLARRPAPPDFLPTSRRALAVADPPEEWALWLPAA